MTIHHDKLAYGKLAPAKKELSESDILNMLAKLNKDEKEEEVKPLQEEGVKNEE